MARKESKADQKQKQVRDENPFMLEMSKEAGKARAFLRVTLASSDHGLVATPAGGQASSQLRPLADADALLIVPEGIEAAEEGERYEAIVIGEVPAA